MNNPTILLADEPTGNLDSRTGREIMKLFHELHAEKVTLIIVTHRNSLIDLATRVIVVDGGRIVADGPREQVLAALQSGRVMRVAQ